MRYICSVCDFRRYYIRSDFLVTNLAGFIQANTHLVVTSRTKFHPCVHALYIACTRPSDAFLRPSDSILRPAHYPSTSLTNAHIVCEPTPSLCPRSSLTNAHRCIGYRNPTANMTVSARLMYHCVFDYEYHLHPLHCTGPSPVPPSVRETSVFHSHQALARFLL